MTLDTQSYKIQNMQIRDKTKIHPQLHLKVSGYIIKLLWIMVYGFRLVFFSNFVPKSTVFDLETRVRGHSRSSKIIPFNPAPMTSY